MSQDELASVLRRTNEAIEQLSEHSCNVGDAVENLRQQHESIARNLVEVQTTLNAVEEKVDQVDRVVVRGNGKASMVTRVHSLEEKIGGLQDAHQKTICKLEEREREAKRGKVGVWTAMIAAITALGTKALELIGGATHTP